MSYELTQEEADEGRRLLRFDVESFFRWSEEKLVIDHAVLRQTIERCLNAGDVGRAERLLNGVIETQTYEQRWKDLRHNTIRLVWPVMVFLGVIGGVVYLFREIFK